jgi:hypothetical protein
MQYEHTVAWSGQVNAMALYSRVPLCGLPTSFSGTRKVITPVFLLYDACFLLNTRL